MFKDKFLNYLLLEAEAEKESEEKYDVVPTSPEDSLVIQNASLDEKVDRYLVKYEKDSVPTSETYVNFKEPSQPYPMDSSRLTQRESKGFNNKFLKVLFEQDEDAPDLGAGGGTDDEGGPALGAPGLPDDTSSDTGEGTEGSTSPTPTTPTINIKKFADNVARLIENRESLLDIKSTMINRAQAFILKNYDAAIAKELAVYLETNFGLTSKLPLEKQKEIPDTLAVGASGDADLGGGGGATP